MRWGRGGGGCKIILGDAHHPAPPENPFMISEYPLVMLSVMHFHVYFCIFPGLLPVRIGITSCWRAPLMHSAPTTQFPIKLGKPVAVTSHIYILSVLYFYVLSW